jgi:DNA sulfur modification protein DndB
MLDNVHEAKELRSLALLKKQEYDFISVKKADLQEALDQGWQVQREGKTRIRLRRPKRKDVLLEDRVWTLLYKMGFTHLSGKGGATLTLDPDNPDSPANQIDVVGLDAEVAIAIECKTADSPKKYPEFQQYLAKHSVIRERFAKAVHKRFPLPYKRIPVLAIFTWDFILTDKDIERAKCEKVVLFNENDLDYYLQLVAHLGPAAKYQLFADMLPGRTIHGLKISLPAIRARMGKYTCYNFSITPEYLLKIAYVSHRAKGKATDVDTYQRMIKKTRLKKIREYITEQGIFPTNIVINFENRRHVQFDLGQQEGSPDGAKYGTLHLKPAYRAAWIIDGQHRLFAYSGHERASTSYLNVLAFEALPPHRQAQLFIDINHEQKSVKQNLLQELYAELHWEAEDEDTRVGAIISKAIQVLDEQKDSPFYERILWSDDIRTPKRCITLNALFRAINQPKMFIVKNKVEYGPLWAGENAKTLKRTVHVVKQWFNFIRGGANEWWDLGGEEGGGLAMNDGITICSAVLRSVIQDLSSKGINVIQTSDDEVVELLRPFGQALGEYLGRLSADERRSFRLSSRGVQGQTAGRRRCEKALHEKFSDFEPPGLKEQLELEEAETNKQAYDIIQRIEKTIHSIIIDALKAEYSDGDSWWFNGVPSQVRKKIVERIEDERGKGGREDYFDLIDFRRITMENWSIFQDVLAYGKGNKEKRTEWIVKLNELRNIVMHPAKRRTITFDQLTLLREYDEWLQKRVTGEEA